ncbi:MAG: 5'/3'-nucleotidase SurE [Vampirovibrionales bacterium]|nr:5'/3'-nucleotidase SurE [Vampirovibrionales bacterium]
MTSKLTILVSNDDGIQAAGIRTLVTWLSKYHNVIVVAPDRERSAMGHALTLHKPLRVDEVPFETSSEFPVQAAYSVTGTPSDCIKLALNAILDQRPDVVISGINHGPNLGNDVLYSGTVSAALEGAIHGLPSVAISLFNGSTKGADFNPSAQFLCEYLPTILAAKLPTRTVLNLNTPTASYEDIKGVRLCKLGTRTYSDDYDRRLDPRGNVYYWLAGEVVLGNEEIKDTDSWAVQHNYVSATPIHFDLTHEAVLNNPTVHKALTFSR